MQRQTHNRNNAAARSGPTPIDRMSSAPVLFRQPLFCPLLRNASLRSLRHKAASFLVINWYTQRIQLKTFDSSRGPGNNKCTAYVRIRVYGLQADMCLPIVTFSWSSSKQHALTVQKRILIPMNEVVCVCCVCLHAAGGIHSWMMWCLVCVRNSVPTFTVYYIFYLVPQSCGTVLVTCLCHMLAVLSKRWVYVWPHVGLLCCMVSWMENLRSAHVQQQLFETNLRYILWCVCVLCSWNRQRCDWMNAFLAVDQYAG